MSFYTLNDLSTCLEVSSDYFLYGKDNTDSNPIPEDALSVMIKNLPSQQRNRLADLLKVTGGKLADIIMKTEYKNRVRLSRTLYFIL